MNTRQVVTDVLRSQLSIYNTKLDPDQYRAVEMAMVEFGGRAVTDYRDQEAKSVKLEAIKLFPALWKGEFKLWLRKRAFIKAKKEAQIRANTENRPVHVVRSSEIAFVVQSTKEVRQLKKVGIYKKNVDAIKMNETADYTAYPLKDRTIPKDRENGANNHK